MEQDLIFEFAKVDDLGDGRHQKHDADQVPAAVAHQGASP